MAKPLFIIGPQRCGTTITVSLACILDGVGVGPRGYEPFHRWDIPFIGELGGDAGRTPLLGGVRRYVDACPDRYAAVRVALPWAWESLGWIKLLDLFPRSRAVIVQRNELDAFASWRSLAYIGKLPWPGHLLDETGHAYLLEAYCGFRFALTHTFDRALNVAAGRVEVLAYEQIVADADLALAPACAMLAVDPLNDAQQYIRKPKHWPGGTQ